MASGDSWRFGFRAPSSCAAHYRHQYLENNPVGYCGPKGAGMSHPIGGDGARAPVLGLDPPGTDLSCCFY
jgi:hypothetical protein